MNIVRSWIENRNASFLTRLNDLLVKTTRFLNDCTTDNPGFHTVCLDQWVLQAAWLDYKKQKGSRGYEGPKHMLLTAS